MTTGSMSFKDGKLHTHEVVTGSSGDVTEVRGTSELLPDGAFRVKTEHLKGGKWQSGREVTYRYILAGKYFVVMDGFFEWWPGPDEWTWAAIFSPA